MPRYNPLCTVMFLVLLKCNASPLDVKLFYLPAPSSTEERKMIFIPVAIVLGIALVCGEQTSAPVNIDQLDGETGSTSVVLSGNDWHYYSLEVSTDSILDLVVITPPLASGGNCQSNGIQLWASVQPKLPEIKSADDLQQRKDVEGSLMDDIAALMERSFFCKPTPELAVSVKSTGNHRRWYILLQSVVTAGTGEQKQCGAQLYYSIRPRNRQILGLVALTALCLFCFIFTAMRFRTNQYEYRPHFRLTWIGVMGTPPLLLRQFVVTGLTECRNQIKTNMKPDPANPPADQEMQSIEEENPEEDYCRICREGDRLEPLIKPCGCSGSLQYVHRSCLDRWRITAAGQNPAFTSHCEICQSPFTIRVGSGAVSKAIVGHVMDLLLLVASTYVILMFTDAIGKVTIGELECLAPYHAVQYAEPFAFIQLALGFLLYSITAFFYLHAVYRQFLNYHNDSSVRRIIQQTGVAPRFWSRVRYLTLVRDVIWSYVALASAGYLVNVLAYASSERFVWNWELSLGSGFVLIVLVGGVAVVCILLRHAIRGNSNETTQEIAPVDPANGGAAGEGENAAALVDESHAV
jgi:hypothetical protein